MAYRLNAKRFSIILFVIAVCSIVLCVGLGPVGIEAETVARMILSHLPGVGRKITADWTDMEYAVVMTVRLPRVLLGFCVGCALAFSGTAMQTLVRNELADPYILGVSSGAAIFSAIGMLFGFFSFMGIYQNAVNGCIGAMVSVIFVFLYSLNQGKVDIDRLLLGGIAISMLAKAALKILTLTNTQIFLQAGSEFWTQGGLASARWDYLKWPILLIICSFLLLLVNFRSMNVLLCGDEAAGTLGVAVPRMQKLLILATSVMIGITVSVSGGIGFVGLVAPHVARILVGGDHRRIFPVGALLGGIFVLWCDVVARMLLQPEEIPVGIFTALIGGPIFLWLMKKRVK